MILTCVVDRVEESIAVLIADDGTVYEVPVSKLGDNAREGAVLRVPTSADIPQWALAALDRKEEATRRTAGRARLERLRGDDGGGDISL